jgi:hypothetical protein
MEEKEQDTLVSSLEDTLGINPEDLKYEPQLATFFKIASHGTNLGSYKILHFKRNQNGKITHAILRPLNMDKVYKDRDGSMKNIAGGKMPHKDVLVPIGELDTLMSQDFAANPTQGF